MLAEAEECEHDTGHTEAREAVSQSQASIQVTWPALTRKAGDKYLMEESLTSQVGKNGGSDICIETLSK